MSSTAGDVLPALPPIRTAPPAETDVDARSSPAAESSSSTAPDAESRPSQAKWEEEGEAGSQPEAAEPPTTPTSEESRLRAPTECPPAPRKPKWAPPLAKRKLPSASSPSPPRRAFFPVARDLSTVFRSLPPKKRIRAG